MRGCFLWEATAIFKALTFLLLSQAGDTFDMSAILCSLLLGVGYNAYVVVGYAPQVCTGFVCLGLMVCL